MGRRKIEIQPITHERNRSVTFLKRKNGLFKKAYELGVLCSVDVAVIIFEERPGHHVKLYQYGSSDIHDIVQKHLRHDGEKDTRGPPDFSGNSSHKLDDMGGDEDDDVDDDDDLPSRSKRRLDGKLKPPPNMSMDYHRNVSVPQPPSLPLHVSSQSGGSGTTLPTSRSRDQPHDMSSRRNKLTLESSHHSRSPSDNPNDPSGYSYHGGQGGPFGSRGSQYQHHGHHNNPHHHPGGSSSSGPYPQFFPVSSHTSPPPSFIPLQEYPRGSIPGRGGSGGGGGGGGFVMPARSSSSNSTYDPPGMYSNSMMRSQPPGNSQPSGPGAGGGGNPDLFAAFLDADEQSRHQNQPQQGPGFVGLDWPVHGSGGGASAAPSGPSSSVSNPSGASSAGPDAPGGNGGNWLDFLSGNNPNSANPPPSAGGARDSSMSWERGGGPGGGGGGDHRGDIADMFGGGGDRGRGSMIGSKRKGEDDGPAGSILASPASVNGRDGKKDAMKDGG